mgnify:CR=1 FL=1|jgi:serine O-acetyltransferase
MELEIDKKELTALLQYQIHNLFKITNSEKITISKNINNVLSRIEFCLSKSKNKYCKKNNKTFFNPFHSGQYSIFLYYFSNSIYNTYKESQIGLANKIYYLNKSLNGLDLLYDVKMPKVFFLEHPVGSVLGKAKYGEYFTFFQGCTVGGNKGVYPKIGKHVKMLSGSKILGNCNVGDQVIFSANSYIKDTSVPSNTIVFGHSPSNKFKKIKNFKALINRYFEGDL